MFPKIIEEVANLFLQLQNIENPQSEVGRMKDGKIVTIETLNEANPLLVDNNSHAQSLNTAEQCRNNLQYKLIALDITPNSKITADSLCPQLKDTIIAYYMQQGLTIDEIIELIDNCDNNIETLKTALETKLEYNNINYTLDPENNKIESYLDRLTNYLDTHITDDNKRSSILDTIAKLAVDSEQDTIATIHNNLKYEFDIKEPFIKGIIKSLYGEKTTSIFYNHKNDVLLQQKQQDEDSKLKYKKLKTDLDEKQRKEQDEACKKYCRLFSKEYRANGLELEKKHSLAIGSNFINYANYLFDAHTTVLADLDNADLTGNILHSIKSLHSELANRNKFKYICFMNRFMFNTIGDSLSLMSNIYDILQPGGIVMITTGPNPLCREISSNKGFIDNILIPAKFSKNDIVTLHDSKLYEYENCLSLLEHNNHILKSSPNEGVRLIARKAVDQQATS
jgi:SAM-dependent methyltransferase